MLAAYVFSASALPPIEGFSLDRLRNESLLTANLARRIVKDQKLADTAFTAGIVHDVGQLVLVRDSTKDYSAVLRKVRETRQPLSVVEKNELGVTHGGVGAYLLGVWGLPFVLAEAAAFHAEPSAVLQGNLDVLAAVHLADGLAGAVTSGTDPLTDGTLDLPFLDDLYYGWLKSRWGHRNFEERFVSCVKRRCWGPLGGGGDRRSRRSGGGGDSTALGRLFVGCPGVSDPGIRDEHDHLLGVRAVPDSAAARDLVLPLLQLPAADRPLGQVEPQLRLPGRVRAVARRARERSPRRSAWPRAPACRDPPIRPRPPRRGRRAPTRRLAEEGAHGRLASWPRDPTDGGRACQSARAGAV